MLLMIFLVFHQFEFVSGKLQNGSRKQLMFIMKSYKNNLSFLNSFQTDFSILKLFSLNRFLNDF